VLPPQLQVWHRLWVAPSQVLVVPAPQVPLALLAPHPAQLRPVVRLLVPQLSGHSPLLAAVPQPLPELHVTVQHWLLPPTWHVVCPAVQEHRLHTSPVPEQ
jgi:hypothetical protein